MDYWFTSSGLRLSAHLAEPPSSAGAPPGLVLCHGFPVRGRESTASGKSFPELADRIALELGWIVLTMNFRGCGRAEGNFSMRGWQDDIHAAVDHVKALGATSVWLAGFGTGASLCIAEAGDNSDVAGVAATATPADFADWGRNPRRLLLHSREVGVVKDEDFPPSFDRWAAEIRALDPVAAVRKLADRPLLLLHGENDDLVPSMDTRILADAHGNAEMHIVSGAGHELRHDPRAVAILLGWLARQQNAALAR
jgi:putative redox protein